MDCSNQVLVVLLRKIAESSTDRDPEKERERERERMTERTESVSRNANLLSDNIKIKFSSQEANRGQRRGGEEEEHSVWAAA